MRKKLKKYVNYDLKTFMESVKYLDWKYSKKSEDDSEITLQCNCPDSKMKIYDFFGQRMIRCENCGKMMLSILPASSIDIENKKPLLDSDKFKIEKDKNGNEKFWIAIRGE